MRPSTLPEWFPKVRLLTLRFRTIANNKGVEAQMDKESAAVMADKKPTKANLAAGKNFIGVGVTARLYGHFMIDLIAARAWRR